MGTILVENNSYSICIEPGNGGGSFQAPVRMAPRQPIAVFFQSLAVMVVGDFADLQTLTVSKLLDWTP
jgi:hypothetical protein